MSKTSWQCACVMPSTEKVCYFASIPRRAECLWVTNHPKTFLIVDFSSSTIFQIESEYGNITLFKKRKKLEYPKEKLSMQGREPTSKSIKLMATWSVRSTCWARPVYRGICLPAMIAQLKRIWRLRICQSGWKEIRKTLPVVRWIHWGPRTRISALLRKGYVAN